MTCRVSHPWTYGAAVLVHPSCVLCGAASAVVCDVCASTLRAAPSLPVPLHLDACSALFEYSTARPLVTALKNGGRRDLLPWLADRLSERATPPRGAIVTWAPTGAARRRARGYDQAELLARALARRWGLPCAGLLGRRSGLAQAGLSGPERRANPSFAALRRCPDAVVLVDDVATTGATLTAAGRVLRAAGAHVVSGVVVARAGGARRAFRAYDAAATHQSPEVPCSWTSP